MSGKTGLDLPTIDVKNSNLSQVLGSTLSNTAQQKLAAC